jgi:hypothetical protein
MMKIIEHTNIKTVIMIDEKRSSLRPSVRCSDATISAHLLPRLCPLPNAVNGQTSTLLGPQITPLNYIWTKVAVRPPILPRIFVPEENLLC